MDQTSLNVRVLQFLKVLSSLPESRPSPYLLPQSSFRKSSRISKKNVPYGTVTVTEMLHLCGREAAFS